MKSVVLLGVVSALFLSSAAYSMEIRVLPWNENDISVSKLLFNRIEAASSIRAGASQCGKFDQAIVAKRMDADHVILYTPQALSYDGNWDTVARSSLTCARKLNPASGKEAYRCVFKMPELTYKEVQNRVEFGCEDGGGWGLSFQAVLFNLVFDQAVGYPDIPPAFKPLYTEQSLPDSWPSRWKLELFTLEDPDLKISCYSWEENHITLSADWHNQCTFTFAQDHMIH